MTIPPSIREISLTRVDLDTHPFKIAKAEDLGQLKESLATVGLLSLPRVQSVKRGWWQAITGWKRLKAAAQLGWRKIPAVVLDPDTSEAHLLLLYLHDNAFSRAFNPLEQALLASRLLAHWDREALVRKCLPLLGLPPAAAHLDRLLAVARLETPWQELVAQETLALTAAARLAAWDPADRAAALPFLASLPLSQSKQEEFVAGVEILARREGISPAGILHRKELQQNLGNTTLSPKERTEAIRRQLKEWVAPRFSAAQKVFAAGLDRLGLKHHPRVRLSAPPAFEGPDFHLEIKFQDANELEKYLEELSRMVKEEQFLKLMSL
jgi:ParB-like chromosome segregation protein Spo0J